MNFLKYIRNFFLAGILNLSFIITTHAAFAEKAADGYFDCKPETSYEWKRGKLVEAPYFTRLGVHFQKFKDNSATLATGIKPPWEELSLQVTNPLDSKYGLSAETSNGFAHTSIRIKADKKSGLIYFLLFNTQIVSAGHCQYLDTLTAQPKSPF